LLTDHNVREVLKITDRSYLIKDGHVVTQGTPQQLINDPIAISEYLGTTFTDNTFGPAATPLTSPPPPQTNGDLHTITEREQVRRWVEALKSDQNYGTAVTELLKRPTHAVPLLFEALERREADLRMRSFEVLKKLVEGSLSFDPYGTDETRAKQLGVMRRQLGLDR
jgi:ABC-type multidrug transport system ATPase subunit